MFYPLRSRKYCMWKLVSVNINLNNLSRLNDGCLICKVRVTRNWVNPNNKKSSASKQPVEDKFLNIKKKFLTFLPFGILALYYCISSRALPPNLGKKNQVCCNLCRCNNTIRGTIQYNNNNTIVVILS